MASTTEAYRPTSHHRDSLHALLVSTRSQRLDYILLISTVRIADSAGLFLLSHLHGSSAAAVCLTLSFVWHLQLATRETAGRRRTDSQHHLIGSKTHAEKHAV